MNHSVTGQALGVCECMYMTCYRLVSLRHDGSFLVAGTERYQGSAGILAVPRYRGNQYLSSLSPVYTSDSPEEVVTCFTCDIRATSCGNLETDNYLQGSPVTPDRLTWKPCEPVFSVNNMSTFLLGLVDALNVTEDIDQPAECKGW